MMCIYGLFDPSNQELRYVGFTTKPIEERLRGHLKSQSLKKHNHKNFWIKTLLKVGLKPSIEAIQETNEKDWVFDEQWNIEYFKSIGCRLTNIASGGCGTIGFKHSDESKKNIGLKSVGRNIGKKPSALCKEQQLKAMRKLSDHQIREIVKEYYGGKVTYPKLAEMYGVNERTISRIIKKELVYLRDGKTVAPNTRRKIEQNAINEICDLYWSGVYNQTEIAKIYSIHNSVVSEVVNQKDNYRYTGNKACQV